MGENNSQQSAILMRDVIDKWRDIALTVPSHLDTTLGDHPITWWFDIANATTEEFMRALASDPELVVPGRPAESAFVTRFLRPTRPMGIRLAEDRPIVENWITDGDKFLPGRPHRKIRALRQNRRPLPMRVRSYVFCLI